MLEDLRENLIQESACLFTDIAACTGFSTELIEAVIDQSQYIFDIEYIMDNIPVFRMKDAREILWVIRQVFNDITCEEPQDDDSFPEVDLDFMGYFDHEEQEVLSELTHLELSHAISGSSSSESDSRSSNYSSGPSSTESDSD